MGFKTRRGGLLLGVVPLWIVHALLVFAMLAVFGYRVGHQLSSGPARNDAIAYMQMAYNLSRHGVLSLSMDAEQLEPTTYRAPGYPVFVAGVLAFTGESRVGDVNDFLNHPLYRLKMVQAALIFCLGLMSAFLVWRLTGSAFWPYLAFLGVAGTELFHRGSATLNAEPLAAFLALGLSFFLLRSIETRKLRFFVAAGVIGGLLALTRLAFFYIWPFVLLLFLVVMYRNDWDRRVMAGAVVFLLAFSLVTGSWMARNYYHFGEPVLTMRGGLALLHRTEFDQMTATEFAASFCFWSNCKPIKSLLKNFEPEDYARLDWRNEDGYYMRARLRRVQLQNQLGDEVMADKALKQEAFTYLKEHPVRHTLVSLSMGHRSIYVHGCILSFVALIGSLGFLIRAILLKQDHIVGFMLPFLFTIAFNSFLTQGISKYNYPVVPIMWVGTAVFLSYLYQRALSVVGSKDNSEVKI